MQHIVLYLNFWKIHQHKGTLIDCIVDYNSFHHCKYVHMQGDYNLVEQELHQNCMLELDFVQQGMKHVEHIVQYLYVKSLSKW